MSDEKGKKRGEGAFPGDLSPAMPWLDETAKELRLDPASPFYDVFSGYLTLTHRKGRRKQTNVHERMDYALLDPCLTAEQLFAACDNAKLYKMRSVVVEPDKVALCVRKLYGVLDPRVCAVIGFPFGFGTTEAKVRETEVAMTAGAHEITLIPNIGAVKNGAWGPFETEVFKVRRAVGKTATFNLVIDKTFLSEKECEEACRIARRCSVDFVQTSSGYGPNVVANTSVILMKNNLSDYCGITAAGGVNTLRKCVSLLNHGADRLLTPYAPAICEEELFENRVWREVEYNTTFAERKARRDPYVMRTFEREEYVRRRHEEYLESVKVIKSKMWSGEKLTDEEKDAMHFSFTRERWDFDMRNLKDPDPWLVSMLIAARYTRGFHEYRYDYYKPDGIYYPFMSPLNRTERGFIRAYDHPSPEKEWRKLKHEEDKKVVNVPSPEKKNEVKFLCFTPHESRRKNVEVTEVMEKIRERNETLKKLAELEKEEESRPKYERLALEKAERRRARLEAERAADAKALERSKE